MKLHAIAFALITATAAWAQPAAPGSDPVRTVKPERAQASGTLRLPARTAPVEQAYIYSRATGVIAERRVDIGDRVKQGDILAVIAAPELDKSVERAQAGVAQAEARAELAKVALERGSSMAKNRVIAEEELDTRSANARTADADLLAARAELRRLEELRKFLTIEAPFDATVAGRRVDRGAHVQGDPNGGEAWLFYLVRLDELRVEVDAPPRAALQLNPGQTATVEFPEMPGRPFQATVARSSRVIDPESGTMRAELALPNAELALPAGLTGTAIISTGGAASTLLVPTNAIVVRDGKSHVAKLVDGKVDFVPVKTGRNLGRNVEVLEGLKGDESIIPSPNALLAPGAKATNGES